MRQILLSILLMLNLFISAQAEELLCTPIKVFTQGQTIEVTEDVSNALSIKTVPINLTKESVTGKFPTTLYIGSSTFKDKDTGNNIEYDIYKDKISHNIFRIQHSFVEDDVKKASSTVLVDNKIITKIDLLCSKK